MYFDWLILLERLCFLEHLKEVTTLASKMNCNTNPEFSWNLIAPVEKKRVYLGLPDSLTVSERFESLGERPALEMDGDLERPLLGLSEVTGRDEALREVGELLGIATFSVDLSSLKSDRSGHHRTEDKKDGKGGEKGLISE